MIGYLNNRKKSECFGCEACSQICAHDALTMEEDEEGFRYPVKDQLKCVNCGLCNQVCPYEQMPIGFIDGKYTYGGYIKDATVRDQSTSGGAFSAIVDAWCDENYVIFGAAADGLKIYHTYITDKRELGLFRKSKYSQSIIGTAFKDARGFLKEGKKVLFSGTPCQIAGLKAFLRNVDQTNLLTIEVICEGVPSPLYVRKYDEFCQRRYKSPIAYLDYRYKDCSRWDFESMETVLEKDKKKKYKAKWDFQVMLTKLRGGYK